MTQPLNLEAGATRTLTDKEAMKVSVGALIGTAMEWYDFFLFSAAAALVFNVQYFSNDNATAAPSPRSRLSAWGWWPARWAEWSSAPWATGSAGARRS